MYVNISKFSIASIHHVYECGCWLVDEQPWMLRCVGVESARWDCTCGPKGECSTFVLEGVCRRLVVFVYNFCAVAREKYSIMPVCAAL